MSDESSQQRKERALFRAHAHALVAAGRHSGGLYLGEGARGWIWAPQQRSLLVLGPSRSGKTSSVVIPNILMAPGAVVTTSTKTDVVSATAPSRQQVGWTLSFQPNQDCPLPRGVLRAGWSPVNGAGTFDRALRRVEAMAHTMSPTHAQRPLDHWQERGSALLATLLHAGDLGSFGLREVLSWVDRHDAGAALSLLHSHKESSPLARDLLVGILSTEGKERSGIWSSASGLVRPYRSETALSASEPPFFDADAFVRSSNTLYIAAPGSDQAMVAPMVVALLSEIREAAYRAHDEGTLAYPVLFALDELAHIAPLPDLPSLVAEGGGQGVLTLGCLQDLSQARRRWGEEGAAFPSLFSTTLVLPGIADTKTLRLLAMLAGEERVLEQSVSFTSAKHGDSSSRTQSAHLRSRLAPDEIGRGRPGKALVVDSHNQMGWVQLTPAHKSRPFSTALERVRITKEL